MKTTKGDLQSGTECESQIGQGERASYETGRRVLLDVVSRVRWDYVIGFALCQTWNVLCVAIPDPFTYTPASPDLRWLSALTAFVLLVPAVLYSRQATALLMRRSTLLTVGIIASGGTVLGPLSGVMPMFSTSLIYFAAIFVGVGFAYLFLAWYLAFCQARDMNGLAVSLLVSALLTYPLASMLETNLLNQWVTAVIASALPVVSILILYRSFSQSELRDGQSFLQPSSEAQVFAAENNGVHEEVLSASCKGLRSEDGRILLVRLCLCIFIAMLAIETARNLFIAGAALSFYSGVINLIALLLKPVFCIALLLIFGMNNARGLSFSYRVSFLIILLVILCIPFLRPYGLVVHGLIDVGAFLFQLIALVVAYEICTGFRLPVLIVFGSLRIVWAFGLLAGIVTNELLQTGGTDSVALIAVLLGFATTVAFIFVFTDSDCVNVLMKTPPSFPAQTSRFRQQCENLGERAGLSEREAEVMALVAKGRSSTRIASDLSISLATANSHIHHIYQKLGIHSRQQLLDLIENIEIEVRDRS